MEVKIGEEKQKSLVGKVMSHKTDKTVMVGVEQVSNHPLYHKTMRSVLKFQAHDEKNEAKPGIIRVLRASIIQTEALENSRNNIEGRSPQVKPTEIA